MAWTAPSSLYLARTSGGHPLGPGEQGESWASSDFLSTLYPERLPSHIRTLPADRFCASISPCSPRPRPAAATRPREDTLHGGAHPYRCSATRFFSSRMMTFG